MLSILQQQCRGWAGEGNMRSSQLMAQVLIWQNVINHIFRIILALLLTTHMFLLRTLWTLVLQKGPSEGWAFSWLKAATTTFTFKTLLRHYAK